ncbi:hypothetical protein D3C80_1200920 [compost metagenome]
MDHAPFTEAHFVLGRVHIDVDAGGVDFQKQYKSRVPAVEQHIAIRLAHRVGDQFVAHRTAIDEEILKVGLAAREGRQTDPAPQVQAVALYFNRQGLFEKTRPAYRRHTPCAGSIVMGFMQAENALAVMTQVKAHVEASQRQAPDHFLQVIEFGFFGLEKLAPGRGIEEQVAHFDRGANRVGRWLHPWRHVAAFGFYLPGLVGITGTRGQRQACHRTDGSQRFAAKPQAHDPLEVFEVANLAGGVPGQGQRQVVGGDAATVVAHAQQLHPALLDVHVDAPGT